MHAPDRTTPHRLLLILNPGSRGGRGRRLWRRWLDALHARGCHVATEITRTLDDATAFAAAARDVDAVVACGGDGTIGRVADGLLRQPPDRRPPLGVLYAGTSPDFCRRHGIPIDPDAAVDALLIRPARAIDIAHIRCRDDAGRETDGHFVCGANIGIGALVARRANRWRPWLGDTAGTGLALIAALASRFPTLAVTLDDAPPRRLTRCCNLAVAKNPFIASGIRLGLATQPDDGRAAVVAIHATGRAALLRRLPALYRGGMASLAGAFAATATAVRIDAESPCRVEFDGDPRGWLPAAIRIVPRALRLLGGSPPPDTAPRVSP